MKKRDMALWSLMGSLTIIALVIGLSSNQAFKPTTDGPIIVSSAAEVEVEQLGPDPQVVASIVHDQVNVLRDAKKVQLLSYDPELERIALLHSMDMAERDYFAHENPEGQGPATRALDEGYNCAKVTHTGIGENLALLKMPSMAGGSDEQGRTHSWILASNQEIADEIFYGWYESRGHYENMYYSLWDREGIGIFISDNRVYATQLFC